MAIAERCCAVCGGELGDVIFELAAVERSGEQLAEPWPTCSLECAVIVAERLRDRAFELEAEATFGIASDDGER